MDERVWNIDRMILTGETEVFGKGGEGWKAVSLSPQMPRGLAWDRTRGCTVGSRQLIA